MTTFWIAAAILFLVAAFSVVLPLLRRPKPASAPDPERSNLSLLADQLAELERDVQGGTLGEDELAEGRLELERRLLEEAEASSETDAPRARTGKPVFLLMIGLAVPAAASLIYFQLGRFDAIAATTPAHMGDAAGATDAHSLDEVIQSLAKRLESQPNDAQGWLTLARSYAFQRDFANAAAAWARAHALVGDHPDLLAAWADSLLMLNGGRFDARSLDLINRALAMDPNHTKALWLSGTEAFEAGDYARAIEIWERLAALAPEGSKLEQTMASNLAEARALAAAETPPR
jgi:cytochrome c-type biogenesis protein CcmH